MYNKYIIIAQYVHVLGAKIIIYSVLLVQYMHKMIGNNRGI